MNSFKKYIVTGLLAILPAAFTWIIIVYLYNIFTSPGSYVVSIVYNFLYGNQFEINDYLINFLSFLFTLFYIYIWFCY